MEMDPEIQPTLAEAHSETAALVGKLAAFYALALLIVCTYVAALAALLEPDHPHVMAVIGLGVACFAFAILAVTSLAFYRMWLFRSAARSAARIPHDAEKSTPVPVKESVVP